MVSEKPLQVERLFWYFAPSSKAQNTKLREDATKLREDATKLREDATKLREDATKLREDATKSREEATKSREEATKSRDSAPFADFRPLQKILSPESSLTHHPAPAFCLSQNSLQTGIQRFGYAPPHY